MRISVALTGARAQVRLIQGGLILVLNIAIGVMIAHTSWTFFPIAILVAAIATYLAYNHPILTVVLIVILSTITDNLSGFLSIPTVIDVGLFNLRLWDPLFSGILVTLFLKLFDYQLIQALLRYYLLLILLFVLLILQLMLNIGVYGINALGEFRTYYSPLLMMPYLAIFMRTTEQRLRMLKVLMILSFSFIAVVLLNGLFTRDIGLIFGSLGLKLIGSSGALALLYGLVALLLTMNRRIMRVSPLLLALVFLTGGFLVLLTAHRSVWLATTLAFLTLYLLREFRLKRQAQFVLIAYLVGVTACFALSNVGQNPVEFIETRLLAFTDPEQDPTAYWRQYLWRTSLEEIRQNPWLGSGLGKHFQLTGPAADLITTSPHSLYVTIPFQIGIPGLLFYLAFIGMLFLRFMRLRVKQCIPASDRAILTVGIVVLVAAHAYYVSYTMDWITWLYVGLAGSVLVNQKQ